MPARIEIVPGERHGRLTIIGESESKISGNQLYRMVQCRCDCGKIGSIRLSSLRTGNTTSCGCHAAEVAKQNGLNSKTHGLSQHSLYDVWTGMKQRCYDQNHRRYHRYGGRGITVCEAWYNNVESFYEWAMASGYQEGLEIDRIDNNQGYSPDNCRWVTPKENQRNRSDNVVVEFKGRIACLIDHCEALDLTYSTVYQRINNYGWSTDLALSTPTA
jgi:hypothetical protein